MSDLISRQEAIEAVKAQIPKNTRNWNNDAIIEAISRAVEDIENLPSAEPKKGRWIPVSERLPEDGLVIGACGKTGKALYISNAQDFNTSAEAGYAKAWMAIEPYETD